MSDNYNDIMHLLYPKSKKRSPMPRSHRAVQFAPFAALTGHDGAVREVARLTTDKIELDQSSIDRLNEKLHILRKHRLTQPRVTITHFQQDEKKSGGAYVITKGVIKKIDDYQRIVVMTSGMLISISDILEIECEELFGYEEGF